MKRTAFISILGLAAVGILLAAGCSCEEDPSGRPVDAGSDAAELDAGDGGYDAAPPFVEEEVPVETRDAGDCQGRCCALPDEVSLLGSDFEDMNPVEALAVDSRGNRFASIDRGPGSCIDELLFFDLDTEDYLPEIYTVFDVCLSIGNSAIGFVDDGWLLLWIDDRDSTEVWSVVYRPGDILDPVEVFRVSENTRPETEVAMTRLPDSVMVAWVEDEFFGTTQAVAVRQISLDGEPMQPARIIRESNALVFSGLELSPLGSGKVALVYKALDGTSMEIAMHTLSVSDEEAETYEVVAQSEGIHGSVGLGVDEEGGAIVYSSEQPGVGEQVRFRTVNAAGQLGQNEIKLVTNPNTGGGASIAKLLTGYMVAYRAQLNDPDGDQATIRVIFTDHIGNVQGSSDVHKCMPTGNRTSVRISSDLRAAVTWSDYDRGEREKRLVNLWCME